MKELLMSSNRYISALIIFFTVVILVTTSSINVYGSEIENPDKAPADIQLYTAQIYAKHYGVTVDEAIFRLKVPFLLPDLQPALQNNESDTYGGAWIQNEPEFKVVLAFTRDGTKTATKYSQYIPAEVAPYLDIRIVQKSLTQLLDDQKQVMSALQEIGLKAGAGIDVINNRAKLDVSESDRAAFEDFTKVNAAVLPKNIEVNYVTEMARPDNVYGGLIQPQGGTTGFSVINGSGVKGVATAGHLPDDVAINDPNGNYVEQTYQFGIYSGIYDCQWSVPWYWTTWAMPTNRIQYWSDGSTLPINYTTRSLGH
jgi:hypothetical protein